MRDMKTSSIITHEKYGKIPNKVQQIASLDSASGFLVQGEFLVPFAPHTTGIFKQAYDWVIGLNEKSQKKMRAHLRPKNMAMYRDTDEDGNVSTHYTEYETFQSPFANRPDVYGVRGTIGYTYDMLGEGMGLTSRRHQLIGQKQGIQVEHLREMNAISEKELKEHAGKTVKDGDVIKFGGQSLRIDLPSPEATIHHIEVSPYSAGDVEGKPQPRWKVSVIYKTETAPTAHDSEANKLFGATASSVVDELSDKLSVKRGSNRKVILDLLGNNPTQSTGVMESTFAVLGKKGYGDLVDQYVNMAATTEKEKVSLKKKLQWGVSVSKTNVRHLYSMFSQYVADNTDLIDMDMQTVHATELVQNGAYAHMSPEQQAMVRRQTGLNEDSPELNIPKNKSPKMYSELELIDEKKGLWGIKRKQIVTVLPAAIMSTALSYRSGKSGLPFSIVNSAVSNFSEAPNVQTNVRNYLRALTGNSEDILLGLAMASHNTNTKHKGDPGDSLLGMDILKKTPTIIVNGDGSMIMHAPVEGDNLKPKEYTLSVAQAGEILHQAEAVANQTDETGKKLTPKSLDEVYNELVQNHFEKESGLKVKATYWADSSKVTVDLKSLNAKAEKAIRSRFRFQEYMGARSEAMTRLVTGGPTAIQQGGPEDSLPVNNIERIIDYEAEDAINRQKDIKAPAVSVGTNAYVVGEQSLAPDEIAMSDHDAINMYIAEAKRNGVKVSRKDALSQMMSNQQEFGRAFDTLVFRSPHIDPKSAQIQKVILQHELTARGSKSIIQAGTALMNALSEMLSGGDFDKDTNNIVGVIGHWTKEIESEYVNSKGKTKKVKQAGGWSPFAGLDSNRYSRRGENFEAAIENPADEYGSAKKKRWHKEGTIGDDLFAEIFSNTDQSPESLTQKVRNAAGAFWKTKLNKDSIPVEAHTISDKNNEMSGINKVHIGAMYQGNQRMQFALATMQQNAPAGQTFDIRHISSVVQKFFMASYQSALDQKIDDRGATAWLGLRYNYDGEVKDYSTYDPVNRFQEFLLTAKTGTSSTNKKALSENNNSQLVAEMIVPIGVQDRDAHVARYAAKVAELQAEYWSTNTASIDADNKNTKIYDTINAMFIKDFGLPSDGTFLNAKNNAATGILLSYADKNGFVKTESGSKSVLQKIAEQSALIHSLVRSSNILDPRKALEAAKAMFSINPNSTEREHEIYLDHNINANTHPSPMQNAYDQLMRKTISKYAKVLGGAIQRLTRPKDQDAKDETQYFEDTKDPGLTEQTVPTETETIVPQQVEETVQKVENPAAQQLSLFDTDPYIDRRVGDGERQHGERQHMAYRAANAPSFLYDTHHMPDDNEEIDRRFSKFQAIKSPEARRGMSSGRGGRGRVSANDPGNVPMSDESGGGIIPPNNLPPNDNNIELPEDPNERPESPLPSALFGGTSSAVAAGASSLANRTAQEKADDETYDNYVPSSDDDYGYVPEEDEAQIVSKPAVPVPNNVVQTSPGANIPRAPIEEEPEYPPTDYSTMEAPEYDEFEMPESDEATVSYDMGGEPDIEEPQIVKRPIGGAPRLTPDMSINGLRTTEWTSEAQVRGPGKQTGWRQQKGIAASNTYSLEAAIGDLTQSTWSGGGDGFNLFHGSWKKSDERKEEKEPSLMHGGIYELGHGWSVRPAIDVGIQGENAKNNEYAIVSNPGTTFINKGENKARSIGINFVSQSEINGLFEAPGFDKTDQYKEGVGLKLAALKGVSGITDDENIVHSNVWTTHDAFRKQMHEVSTDKSDERAKDIDSLFSKDASGNVNGWSQPPQELYETASNLGLHDLMGQTAMHMANMQEVPEGIYSVDTNYADTKQNALNAMRRMAPLFGVFDPIFKRATQIKAAGIAALRGMGTRYLGANGKLNLIANHIVNSTGLWGHDRHGVMRNAQRLAVAEGWEKIPEDVQEILQGIAPAMGNPNETGYTETEEETWEAGAPPQDAGAKEAVLSGIRKAIGLGDLTAGTSTEAAAPVEQIAATSSGGSRPPSEPPITTTTVPPEPEPEKDPVIAKADEGKPLTPVGGIPKDAVGKVLPNDKHNIVTVREPFRSTDQQKFTNYQQGLTESVHALATSISSRPGAVPYSETNGKDGAPTKLQNALDYVNTHLNLHGALNEAQTYTAIGAQGLSSNMERTLANAGETAFLNGPNQNPLIAKGFEEVVHSLSSTSTPGEITAAITGNALINQGMDAAGINANPDVIPALHTLVSARLSGFTDVSGMAGSGAGFSEAVRTSDATAESVKLLQGVRGEEGGNLEAERKMQLAVANAEQAQPGSPERAHHLAMAEQFKAEGATPNAKLEAMKAAEKQLAFAGSDEGKRAAETERVKTANLQQMGRRQAHYETLRATLASIKPVTEREEAILRSDAVKQFPLELTPDEKDAQITNAPKELNRLETKKQKQAAQAKRDQERSDAKEARDARQSVRGLSINELASAAGLGGSQVQQEAVQARLQEKVGGALESKSMQQQAPALAAQLNHLTEVFDTLAKGATNVTEAHDKLAKQTKLTTSQLSEFHAAAQQIVETVTGARASGNKAQQDAVNQYIPGQKITYGQLADQLSASGGIADKKNAGAVQATLGQLPFVETADATIGKLSFTQKMEAASLPGREGEKIRAQISQEGGFGTGAEKTAWQVATVANKAAALAVTSHFAIKNIAAAFFAPTLSAASAEGQSLSQYSDAVSGISAGPLTDTAQSNYSKQLVNAQTAQRVGFQKMSYNMWSPLMTASANGLGGLASSVMAIGAPAIGAYEATKTVFNKLGGVGIGASEAEAQTISGIVNGTGTDIAGTAITGSGALAGFGATAGLLAAGAVVAAGGISAYIGAGQDRTGVIGSLQRMQEGKGGLADDLRAKASWAVNTSNGNVFDFLAKAGDNGSTNVANLGLTAIKAVTGGLVDFGQIQQTSQSELDYQKSITRTISMANTGQAPTNAQDSVDITDTLYTSANDKYSAAYDQQERQAAVYVSSLAGTSKIKGIDPSSLVNSLVDLSKFGISTNEVSQFTQLSFTGKLGTSASQETTAAGGYDESNKIAAWMTANPKGKPAIQDAHIDQLFNGYSQQMTSMGYSSNFDLTGAGDAQLKNPLAVLEMNQNVGFAAQAAQAATTDSYFARNFNTDVGNGTQDQTGLLGSLLSGKSDLQKNIINNAFHSVAQQSSQAEAAFGSAYADNLRGLAVSNAGVNGEFLGGLGGAMTTITDYGLDTSNIASLIKQNAAGQNTAQDTQNQLDALGAISGFETPEQKAAAAAAVSRQGTTKQGEEAANTVAAVQKAINLRAASLGLNGIGFQTILDTVSGGGGVIGLGQQVQLYGQQADFKQLTGTTLDVSAISQLANTGSAAGNLATQQTLIPQIAQSVIYGGITGNQGAQAISMISNISDPLQRGLAQGMMTGDVYATSALSTGKVQTNANGFRTLLATMQDGSNGGTKDVSRFTDENMANLSSAELGAISDTSQRLGYTNANGTSIYAGLAGADAIGAANTKTIPQWQAQATQEDASYMGKQQKFEQTSYGFSQQEFSNQYGAIGQAIGSGDLTSSAGIQREQTLFNYAQQGQQLDIQGQQMTLGNEQFQAQWQLGKQELATSSSYQLNEMNVGQQHHVQEAQWQQQDIAFQQNKSQMDFGFSMIQSDEDIRFSTGRQRRDAMRQRQQAVLDQSMNMNQSDKEMTRAKQRETWDTEAYNRQVTYFKTNLDYQLQAQDQSKKFHDEGYVLEQKNFDLSKKNYAMQGVWMQAQNALEEKAKVLAGERLVLQGEEIKASEAHATAMAKITANIATLNTAVQNGGTYYDAAVKSGTIFNTMVQQLGSTLFPQATTSLNALFASIRALLANGGGYTNTPMVGGSGSSTGVVKGQTFASGGYTGSVPVNQATGIVHGQEYVIPAAGAPVVMAPGIQDALGKILKELMGIHADGGNAIINVTHGNAAQTANNGLSLYERTMKN